MVLQSLLTPWILARAIAGSCPASAYGLRHPATWSQHAKAPSLMLYTSPFAASVCIARMAVMGLSQFKEMMQDLRATVTWHADVSVAAAAFLRHPRHTGRKNPITSLFQQETPPLQLVKGACTLVRQRTISTHF